MEKGTILRYWPKRGGWYTCIYKRTCVRGKRKGMLECRDVSGKKIFVKIEDTKVWGEEKA